MKQVGAFEAKNRLGRLLDLVEGGEEIAITRHGKQVARLVPSEPAFDRHQARAAVQRLRDRAMALKCKITLKEIKAYRIEGRR
jgi:prevent-host-death family protein